jgi:beta-1,2-mannobiose phosphorylase / 1,2-beta-oligomannan phosphorylase
MASPLKFSIRLLPDFRVLVFATASLAVSCNKASTTTSEKTKDKDAFPDELVSFSAYDKNPIFTGTGAETWDHNIRERGYILKEDDGYHMWYTGFRGGMKDPVMTLGYATSTDGIQWTRYPNNPIFTESWVEDMIVIRHDSLYYMFAEGRNDIAHLLTSPDKIRWTDHGSLDIRQTNGEPLSKGPYGTPTVYVEGDVWHLYYERNDEGIWLATSRDLKEWRNVQDEPVIAKGPEQYDKFGVALNQVIKYGDRYYGYYHGTPTEDWSEWNTNVVVSNDLVHWEKYKNNPILEDNKSSGILVRDGERLRLYTMHDIVQLHFSKTKPGAQ